MEADRVRVEVMKLQNSAVLVPALRRLGPDGVEC
jgi:hypothetical protein